MNQERSAVMTPSDYTVQEHIIELQRVANQMRLAREVRAQTPAHPNIIAGWLNRMFAARPRQERRPQPEIMTIPCRRLPELCIDEALG